MRGILLLAAWLIPAMPVPADADMQHDARNRASFQVEAVREVANDWATARLTVQAEGKDAAAVANTVNRRMKAALDVARKTSGIEVESGSYTTHPVYDKRRIVRWRAQQNLQLSAEDVEKLADLIGKLQSDSLLLSGIHFSVKRETRKALEDELTEEALGQFRDRAGLIARSMQGRGGDWSLIQLSVGHSGAPQPHVAMREGRMMSMDQAAPPAFEAGTSEIRIHVNGTIELE